MQGLEDSGQRERTVGLTGSPNFRDAGGYNADGGVLDWGRIFRSGHLAYLTPDDEARLADLELDMVIDLRRPDERDLEPSKLPEGVTVVGAEITPGSQSSVIYADAKRLGGAQAMFDFMRDINREFVVSQSHHFADVFAAFLENGAQRVLFHCSAGKDRTGFAIAMLQLALGVALEDIEADYLLSRRYYRAEDQLARVRDKYPVDHLSDEELRPMMYAELPYLHEALAAIDETWASRRDYLKEGLGLGDSERRELRRRFVIDP